jgi:hypothetical protein
VPRTLKKIKEPKDDVRLINENFDSISLDLADARGVFSEPIVTGGLLVTAGGMRKIQINVLDVQNKYQAGRLPAFMRYTMYLDTDGDGGRIWPVGADITVIELGTLLVIGPKQEQFILDQVENEKATVTMAIANYDAGDHTCYIYADVFYMPGPDLGAAERMNQ